MDHNIDEIEVPLVPNGAIPSWPKEYWMKNMQGDLYYTQNWGYTWVILESGSDEYTRYEKLCEEQSGRGQG